MNKEMMDKNFSHLSPTGDPTMVDISAKSKSARTAVAESLVILDASILDQLQNEEIHTKKGPVFQTAILAGIMAAKKTSDLIPLCHPIGLDSCHVAIHINDRNQVVIQCTAKTTGKTGVEMEALTGASVAALTIYDMCKGFSHNITIQSTRLIQKTGGKSDYQST